MTDDTFFVHKALDITFRLGKGNFGEDGFDELTIRGARASATVNKVGAYNFGSMQLRIYGMTLDHMNKLSTLGQRYFGPGQRKNQVLLQARVGDGSPTTVFEGEAWAGYIDFAGMPNVGFNVEARPGLVAGLRPVPTASYRGVLDVAEVMKGLAGLMGYTFENSGVDVKLVDQYLPGTALAQAKRLAEAAHITMVIDDGTMAIWPKGGSRTQAALAAGVQQAKTETAKAGIPLISKDSGMVLEPSFDQSGIQVTSVYDPRLVWGGQIKVQCRLPAANRTWTIFALTHTLDAETPHGNWFSRILCWDPSQGGPPPLVAGAAP